MTDALQVGKVAIQWLCGGGFRLDGGAMFGPVPKTLWASRYPVDDDNTIPMVNDPLLLRTPSGNMLVDSGLGNKLTEKQKKIYRVDPTWDLPAALHSCGLSVDDIDYVILTHGDFDHAGGVIMQNQNGSYSPTFPRARYVFHRYEWEDICAPDLRAQATYLRENFIGLEEETNLLLNEGVLRLCPEVTVVHTGGHTRGHQLVEIRSEGQVAIHMGDLMPTHAHVKPLWVMAYDDFPLTVIEQKREIYARYSAEEVWFTSYHDPVIRACRIDKNHKIIATWPPQEAGH